MSLWGRLVPVSPESRPHETATGVGAPIRQPVPPERHPQNYRIVDFSVVDAGVVTWPEKVYIRACQTITYRGSPQEMTDQVPDTAGESDDRYGLLEISDEDTVIYDREVPSAWLQSDHTVDLTD